MWRHDLAGHHVTRRRLATTNPAATAVRTAIPPNPMSRGCGLDVALRGALYSNRYAPVAG